MLEEIERIRRVSDMLCTGHAALRDRYAHRALLLDLAILGLSAWLVALAFVEPRINYKLTPFNLDPQLWMGLLAVFTFCLTIFQLKTDWKARSDSHKRSLQLYAEVKREAGYVLSMNDHDEHACRRVQARYDMASASGIEIPEKQFIVQKRRHKMKIQMSKHLDTNPSASIWLTRIRYWFQDNFGYGGPNEC